MRIVHLGISDLPVLYPRGGAIVRQMVEIAKAQAARGHQVVLYSADERASRVEHHGVEVRSVVCRRSMPLRDIEYARQAVHELLAEPVDILHFHCLPEGTALAGAIPAKKFLSFNYFIFRRGKRTPLFWWYRKTIRKYSCLLPISEYCMRGFKEYWRPAGVAVRVVYNGVNLEQFAPDRAGGDARRHELGIGEDELVVLYVGRVCEQKGSDVLIQAFEDLKARMKNVRLVVAGPHAQFGNEGESDLTRRIQKVGGLYLGAIDEGQLSSIYNMADVFVMPTRRLEMFGMAALEAQACGKPVVASDHGGLREVVSPQSGLLFPVGDPEALTDCLARLLEDRELRRTKAEAARHNALRFGWGKIVEDLDAIYQATPEVVAGVGAS
jgi:glycosyltransferase involved in cell wall biosynthesis